MRAASSAVVALCALTFVTPRVAAAQEGAAPTLLLQLFGGLTFGSGLWEVSRQQMIVRGTEVQPRYDSLRLVRRLEPGVVLGASATIFPRPTIGFTVEMAMLTLPTVDDCTLVFQSPSPDLVERNQQLCTNLKGGSGAATSVAITVGTMYRPFPRGLVSPYVRGEVGVGLRNSSTVEVTSVYDSSGVLSNPFVMILDPGSSRTTATGALAAGMMIPITPGYQARMELRDHLLFLDRVTGPANDQAMAPTERFLQHNVTFLVGLDVVLEHRRGRRY